MRTMKKMRKSTSRETSFMMTTIWTNDDQRTIQTLPETSPEQARYTGYYPRPTFYGRSAS